MNCLTSNDNSLHSGTSMVSSYYASELIPNYKDIVKASIRALKLKDSSSSSEETKTGPQDVIKRKFNFIIPSIVLELNSDSDIVLSKEDLNEFFSTFGEVKYIDIQLNSKKAYVLYKSYFCALFAYETIKEILDEKDEVASPNSEVKYKLVRDEDKGKIEDHYNTMTPIKLNQQNETMNYIPKQYNNYQFNYGYPFPYYNPTYQFYPVSNFQVFPVSFSTQSSREYLYKFVCNYSVQIENDPYFKVTRRIIGNNGANLKKIIYESCIKFQDYSTKVRLRGRGSGYKEGEERKESEEPLQLCVSSLNYSTYIGCCKQIEEMLIGIYNEYYEFCKRRRVKNEFLRKIKKNEYVVNRKKEINYKYS